jgi:hypothetical protein
MKLSWDANEKTSFLLMGERQDYLDEVVIWKSPNSRRVTAVIASDSHSSPAGKVVTQEELEAEFKGQETVLAMQ